jgi:hypothetical protein
VESLIATIINRDNPFNTMMRGSRAVITIIYMTMERRSVILTIRASI